MFNNGIIKWLLKIMIAVTAFFLIFFSVQPFFIPIYMEDSTRMVEGYSYLEKNSVEALFLGSSQMFCAVDAGNLTYKYGIDSYDLGSSGQSMPMTSYYFDEAIKTQTPKIVAIEICLIFMNNSSIGEETFSYNYAPMPMSLKKFNSLHDSLNVNFKKSFEHVFIPLILYHDRWKSIQWKDIDFVFNSANQIDVQKRGYLSREHIEKLPIAYYNGDETIKEIPEESKKAIMDIAKKCKEKKIKLLLFKAPVSNWTKGDSISVKQFALENNLEFIDLNENISEIGIDGNTDFYNKSHLNSSGATKTTDYLASILHFYIE